MKRKLYKRVRRSKAYNPNLDVVTNTTVIQTEVLASSYVAITVDLEKSETWLFYPDVNFFVLGLK